jgi:hypothetical protein
VSARALEAGKSAATARAVARWLCLGATPTFALLALWTTGPGAGPALCSAASTSPLNGMAAMYLLMSAFHAPPWLKLIAGR